MDAMSNAQSILIAHKIIIEKLYFEREVDLPSDLELSSAFNKRIDINEVTKQYKVTISLAINSLKNEVKIEVVVAGVFELADTVPDEIKEDVIQKNTVAILFPYLRSEVTLITAQPDFIPIVIPPININALLENAARE